MFFFLLFYEGKGVARAYVVYRKLAYVAYRRCICNVQLISIPSLLFRTFRNKVITSSRAPCYPRADQCQSNINFCLIRTPKSQKLHLVTSIQKSLNLINRLYWRCPAWVYYDINVIPRKSVFVTAVHWVENNCALLLPWLQDLLSICLLKTLRMITFLLNVLKKKIKWPR